MMLEPAIVDSDVDTNGDSEFNEDEYTRAECDAACDYRQSTVPKAQGHHSRKQHTQNMETTQKLLEFQIKIDINILLGNPPNIKSRFC